MWERSYDRNPFSLLLANHFTELGWPKRQRERVCYRVIMIPHGVVDEFLPQVTRPHSMLFLKHGYYFLSSWGTKGCFYLLWHVFTYELEEENMFFELCILPMKLWLST